MVRIDADAVAGLAGALHEQPPRAEARRTATVQSVGRDGTVWVTVAGNDEPVPCSSTTANVRAGDSVTVEWRASALHVTGCTSSPAVAGREVTEAVAAATGGIAADAGEARGIAAAAQRVARAVNQHFWTDGGGIHVTEATQEAWQAAQTGANVLINSIGQLFRDGTNNLLAIVAGSDPGVAIYDGGGNADANVVASFTRNLIELGRGLRSTSIKMCDDSYTISAGLDDDGNVVSQLWTDEDAEDTDEYARGRTWVEGVTNSAWADLVLRSHCGWREGPAQGQGRDYEYPEYWVYEHSSKIDVLSTGDYSQIMAESEKIDLRADEIVYDDPYNSGNSLQLGMPAHYQHSGSYRIATAGIDTYTNGPHVTLPAGSYIVVGAWVFQSGSSSGARNLQLGFRSGASGSLWGERERIMAAANNFAVLNVSALRTLTSETTVYLAGSSSVTTSSNGDAWITAVRLN